jgi:bla regulator protein blaR1
MIGSWMLYTIAVSALFTLAAHALERIVVARGRPRRMLWVVAMTLSVAWPVANGLRRVRVDEAAPVTVAPFTITVPGPEAIGPVARTPQRGAQIDRALITLWVALSALLLVRLGAGVATLRRARRAWRRQQLDGMTVCVSPNVGPAVVGLRSMHVVLPEWILDLDAPLRALVLRHEQEHQSARDPHLLFGAAAAVCLMPWNPAVWFQARRLRLAIELDCDARVLRAHPTPERYGLLMLTIAQRRSVAPTIFAPMLAEPVTQLELRIREMRNTSRRIARWAIVGGTVLAAAAVTLAGSLRSASATMRAVQSVGSEIATTALSSTAALRQQGNPAPRYPEALRAAGVEGSVVVQVATDENGVPDTASLRVLATTNDLFATSVRQALAKWHLSPRANVRLPFLFVMSNKSGTDIASVPPGTVVITGVPTNAIGVEVAPTVVRTAPMIDSTRTGLREVAVANSPDTARTAARVERDRVRALQPVVVTGAPPRGAGNADPIFVIDGVVQPQQVRVRPTTRSGINIPDTIRTVYSPRPTVTEVPVASSAVADPAYFEFQVERPASPQPGNAAPRYPDSLRVARVEGEVLAQFVVDTLGHPDMGTFKVIKSTHDLFTNTVKASLPNMTFYPALVGGRPVKQLIQMPFQFNLTKDPN